MLKFTNLKTALASAWEHIVLQIQSQDRINRLKVNSVIYNK
jgi:hypothetical protein